MVGVETDIVDAWIVSVLAADAQLQAVLKPRVDMPSKPGIYSDVALPKAEYPHIVFNATDPGQDVEVVGAIRVMSATHYLVRGVARTTTYTGALATIASRIDALLHGKSAPGPEGGYIVASVRQQAYRLTEVVNGVQYRHLGGIYAIDVQS